MSTFTIHTKQTAPLDAVEALETAEAKFGFVPNVIGVLAEAPIAAKAYLALAKLVSQSSLTPTERHVVWFEINELHNCHYCMAAHTAIAHQENIAEDVIDSARSGKPYHEEHLQKLREFTRAMVLERGDLPEEVVQQFLSDGFTKRHILEIITAIANKMISNYTNHLAETPLDDAFSNFTWKDDVAA